MRHFSYKDQIDELMNDALREVHKPLSEGLLKFVTIGGGSILGHENTNWFPNSMTRTD